MLAKKNKYFSLYVISMYKHIAIVSWDREIVQLEDIWLFNHRFFYGNIDNLCPHKYSIFELVSFKILNVKFARNMYPAINLYNNDWYSLDCFYFKIILNNVILKC